MKPWVIISIVAFVLFIVYVLGGRAWLKAQPWAQGFFAWIEPLEIAFWSKSETILWARLKQLTGLVLALLTFTGQIDLTPLMPFVPDQYEGTLKAVFNLLPLLITVVGSVDVKLRETTTKPLEVVALPEAVLTQPAVAAEVAKAADANVAVADAISAAQTPAQN